MIIYENASYLVLHLGKCMNRSYGKMSLFYLIFDKKIMDFMVYWKIKDAYLLLVLGKLIENLFDKNEVKNLINFVEVRLFKVF